MHVYTAGPCPCLYLRALGCDRADVGLCHVQLLHAVNAVGAYLDFYLHGVQVEVGLMLRAAAPRMFML